MNAVLSGSGNCPWNNAFPKPSSPCSVCPSSIILQPLIAMHWWWLIISNGSNEPVHQGPIHPLLPQAMKFVSQGRMCGYIAQFLCFCSTQINLICAISHSLISDSQAVRESFVVYLKLFPNFWNSWVKYSLITNVSHQTIVKTPVCMQVQGFSLSLY